MVKSKKKIPKLSGNDFYRNAIYFYFQCVFFLNRTILAVQIKPVIFCFRNQNMFIFDQNVIYHLVFDILHDIYRTVIQITYLSPRRYSHRANLCLRPIVII